MFYNLYSGEKDGWTSTRWRSQVLEFDVWSSVETISAGDVRQITGGSKAPQPPEAHGGSMRQPTRINFVTTESMELVAACKSLAQKYDLVSVEPHDKKALQLACTTLPIDIVSINLGQASRPVKIDGDLLTRAAARNVYIELQIAGVLEPGRLDAAVAAASAIISSKVPRHMLVLSTGRGSTRQHSPAQLLSLATMLGMKRKHAALAISHNPAALLKSAAVRRSSGIGWQVGSLTGQ